MASVSRKWRVEPIGRASGVHHRLVTGRADDRVTLNLGRVDAAEAERARRRMQVAEDTGAAPRVIAWHAEDQAQAVAYLLGDPEVDALLDPRPDYGAMPLEEYFAQEYSAWRAAKRPGGWAAEERGWKRINAEIGRVRIRDIDEFVVADFLDGLVAQRGARKGQPLAGNAKRVLRAAIAALLKRAYRQKHIAKLPPLAVFELEGATKTVTEKPDPLTLDELVRLLEASEPKYRAMWGVGAGLGLRPSELVRVRWEDVDWSSRTIRIRGEKTEASADVIPMTPIAYRELQRWWMVEAQPAEGLAFPSRVRDGEGRPRPYGPGGYRKALGVSVAAAGLTRRVYPYLLRDSFATIAWTVGLERDVTRRIGRWTDERMLDEVYCRPRPADLVEKARAFDTA